jgi:predicted ATPase
VEAHLALGNSLFLFGKLTPALKHFEQAISLYDPKVHHVHALTYGLDPGVFCLIRSAWILELLGYSGQASKKMEEGLALVHRQSHAFSLAVALVHPTVLSYLRREWRRLQEQAETAIAFCTEQGFGNILAQARSYKGYALAQQGQPEQGIAELRAGMDAQFATGASLFRPWFFCFLAEAYGTAGRGARSRRSGVFRLFGFDRRRFPGAVQNRGWLHSRPVALATSTFVNKRRMLTGPTRPVLLT